MPPDTKLNLPRTGAVVIAREVNCASEMVQPNHSKPYLAKCDIEHIRTYGTGVNKLSTQDFGGVGTKNKQLWLDMIGL